jgi:hypothetical protein
MPDQQPGRDRRRHHGPIGRAAPTRPAGPGVAVGRSRRWLLVVAGGVTTALLGGASVALASISGSSGARPAAPVPAATSTAAPGAGPGPGLSDP